jgi:hypothetical protein
VPGPRCASSTYRQIRSPRSALPRRHMRPRDVCALVPERTRHHGLTLGGSQACSGTSRNGSASRIVSCAPECAEPPAERPRASCCASSGEADHERNYRFSVGLNVHNASIAIAVAEAAREAQRDLCRARSDAVRARLKARLCAPIPDLPNPHLPPVNDPIPHVRFARFSRSPRKPAPRRAGTRDTPISHDRGTGPLRSLSSETAETIDTIVLRL